MVLLSMLVKEILLTIGYGWVVDLAVLFPSHVVEGEVWRLITYVFLHIACFTSYLIFILLPLFSTFRADLWQGRFHFYSLHDRVDRISHDSLLRSRSNRWGIGDRFWTDGSLFSFYRSEKAVP